MIEDKNGKQLQVGDVIACKFRIANVIADAPKLNLLVEHFEGHKETPDDWRLQLESSQVILIAPPEHQSHAKTAQPDAKVEHEPAELPEHKSHAKTADTKPEQQPAEHKQPVEVPAHGKHK